MKLTLAVLLAAAAAACGDSESATTSACLSTADPPATAPAAAAMPPGAQLAPADYLALNNQLGLPGFPGWSAAVETLMSDGDAFTLEQLRSLNRANYGAEKLAQLDRLQATIVARTPEESSASLLPVLTLRLERAAWADLRCDQLERTLVPWTLKSVAAFAAAPDVRAELEALRDGYACAGGDPQTQAMMTARVRDYATRLLSPNPDTEAKLR